MYIKNKRGQSTVEYILLVTAVVVVMIAFTMGQGGSGGLLQTQLNSTLNSFVQSVNDETSAYSQTHGFNPGGNGTPSYTVSVNP